MNVYVNIGIGRIVDVPQKLLAEHGMRTHHALRRLDDFPGDFGNDFGDTADHFAIEIFHDLRPALVPPHCRFGDLFAVTQLQHVGKIGVRIRRCGVVVGVIRGVFIAARTRAEGFDLQLVHHVLMILLGCPVFRVDGGLRG